MTYNGKSITNTGTYLYRQNDITMLSLKVLGWLGKP